MIRSKPAIAVVVVSAALFMYFVLLREASTKTSPISTRKVQSLTSSTTSVHQIQQSEFFISLQDSHASDVDVHNTSVVDAFIPCPVIEESIDSAAPINISSLCVEPVWVSHSSVASLDAINTSPCFVECVIDECCTRFPSYLGGQCSDSSEEGEGYVLHGTRQWKLVVNTNTPRIDIFRGPHRLVIPSVSGMWKGSLIEMHIVDRAGNRLLMQGAVRVTLVRDNLVVEEQEIVVSNGVANTKLRTPIYPASLPHTFVLRVLFAPLLRTRHFSHSLRAVLAFESAPSDVDDGTLPLLLKKAHTPESMEAKKESASKSNDPMSLVVVVIGTDCPSVENGPSLHQSKDKNKASVIVVATRPCQCSVFTVTAKYICMTITNSTRSDGATQSHIADLVDKVRLVLRAILPSTTTEVALVYVGSDLGPEKEISAAGTHVWNIPDDVIHSARLNADYWRDILGRRLLSQLLHRLGRARLPDQRCLRYPRQCSLMTKYNTNTSWTDVLTKAVHALDTGFVKMQRTTSCYSVVSAWTLVSTLLLGET